MTRKTLEPEDVLSFKSVTDAQISPDGELVAFVLGDSFTTDTKRPRSSIWVVPTEGGEPRQLTRGPRADTTPRWSPDGQQLAFLSDRVEDGQLQVYLLNRGGGEAVQITTAEGKVQASSRSVDPMAWSPDGRHIAFLRTEAATEEEKRRKDEKDDAIEFEREPKYTHIHVVDIASGVEAAVSPAGLQVWEFCWSPTGAELAVVASDLPYEQDWYTCRLAALSVEGGPVRTLHYSKRQVAKPAWSPDGSSVAFLSSNWSDRGITAGSVFVVSGGGAARNVSAGHVASAAAIAWSDDAERLLTVAFERGGVGVAEIDVASGERTSLWHGAAAVSEASTVFSRDRSGNIALVREDADNPRDVWLGKRHRDAIEWTRLTSFHPQAAELELGATEEVHWKGADGWDMQGLLVRPVGAVAGTRYPMVTGVHGGPTGAHHNRYAATQWGQLLASKGIAVFLPNYRGSTGWGLEFAESNIGDMGGKDWEDILAGVDHCVDEGIADPDRLGIGGGSYGGFMTAWAVTQTDRFRAAVMIAGVSDWRSFHGKSYLCDWDAIHYGDADPWDPDGIYRKFSPITYVKRVRTPTLIIHGEDDEDVPVEQAYLFHRALKDLGAETELVVYPREHHGFVERNHMLHSSRRITDWFAQHLL